VLAKLIFKKKLGDIYVWMLFVIKKQISSKTQYLYCFNPKSF